MTISNRAQIAALFLFGVLAVLTTGCHEMRVARVQTSYGVSGSANPGGESRVSETVPGYDTGIGGSGLSDTRGTSVTGALPGAGSPALGETGNLPTPAIAELGGTGNAPAARAASTSPSGAADGQGGNAPAAMPPGGAMSTAPAGAASAGLGSSPPAGMQPGGGAAGVPPLSPAGDTPSPAHRSINPLHHGAP